MRADAAPDPGRQDRRAGMGAGALRSPRRAMSRSSAAGPAHLPRFVMQVELDGYAPERGEATSKRAAEQAAAKAFLERWAHTMTACGFVALIGAPNAGKSTLAQQAGRRESVDRLAQGADDAGAGARRRGRGTSADRVRRHARAVRAQAPARPGDDATPPGRAASDADVLALIVDARAEAASDGDRRGRAAHSRRAGASASSRRFSFSTRSTSSSGRRCWPCRRGSTQRCASTRPS